MSGSIFVPAKQFLIAYRTVFVPDMASFEASNLQPMNSSVGADLQLDEMSFVVV